MMTARQKFVLWFVGIWLLFLAAMALIGAPASHADTPEPQPVPAPHVTLLPPWCFPDPTVCGFKFDPSHGGWYQP
jgi:hypothetical protein